MHLTREEQVEVHVFLVVLAMVLVLRQPMVIVQIVVKLGKITVMEVATMVLVALGVLIAMAQQELEALEVMEAWAMAMGGNICQQLVEAMVAMVILMKMPGTMALVMVEQTTLTGHHIMAREKHMVLCKAATLTMVTMGLILAVRMVPRAMPMLGLVEFC
uniref:Uncharacterized protein n=1 Tax=Opuntia streptacantha TaxID=393608 RepID=A0A7C8YFD1_OPUST